MWKLNSNYIAIPYFLCACRSVNLNTFIKKRHDEREFVKHPKANTFFSWKSYLEHSRRLVYKKLKSYICRKWPVFPNNSNNICPIKLKIGMLYYRKNTFRHSVYLDISLKVFRCKFCDIFKSTVSKEEFQTTASEI